MDQALFIISAIVVLLCVLLFRESTNFQKKLQQADNHSSQLKTQLTQLQQKLTEKISELATLYREVDKRAAMMNVQFRNSEMSRIEAEQRNLAMAWANNQLEKWKIENEEQIRKESKTKSEDIQIGQIYKRFTPFLEEFPWLPGDTRFLGGPIDFIVFEGLHDDQQKINLHLVQVKTGQASLAKNQKRIKEALDQKRVFWKEIRAPKEIPIEVAVVKPTPVQKPTPIQKPAQQKNYPRGLSEICYSMEAHASSWRTLNSSSSFQQWHNNIPKVVKEALPLVTLKQIWQEAG
ncbi:MAG TPA: Holliday junction resolvase-like protein [Flavilitoribacter sp.]|nr:Holliday junction resolvase-like protein [Flavilitoribacter sp.]HMQ88510.1 Holliday junction resolvase-like protein [Flavilitoribacter sp.]